MKRGTQTKPGTKATNNTPMIPASDPAAPPREGPEPLVLDAVRERLARLGMPHAAEALAAEISESVKLSRPAHAVIDRLLAAELSRREERRMATWLKQSSLPPGMTLAGFDFGFQPGIDRRQIETLGAPVTPASARG